MYGHSQHGVARVRVKTFVQRDAPSYTKRETSARRVYNEERNTWESWGNWDDASTLTLLLADVSTLTNYS